MMPLIGLICWMVLMALMFWLPQYAKLKRLKSRCEIQTPRPSAIQNNEDNAFWHGYRTALLRIKEVLDD